MSDNDNDLFSSTDARVWAQRFVQRAQEIPGIPADEGAMIAWFAGAIEVGRSAGIDSLRLSVPQGGSNDE